MKQALKDLAVSHEALHSKCGTAEGCSCYYCKDGACKVDKPFAGSGSIEERVLCAMEPGATKPHYSCSMGMCDKCGLFQKCEDVFLTGSEARRLDFEGGGSEGGISLGGVFSELQPAKKKSKKRGRAEEGEEEEEEKDQLWEKLTVAGVNAECTLILVDGIRCLNKSDCVAEIKGVAIEEVVKLRFQKPSPRQDIDVFQ